MLSARPDFGKTFNTAMWVIGFVASVQVFAAGWAVISREPGPGTTVKAPVPPPPQLTENRQPMPQTATSIPQTGEFLPPRPVANIPPEQSPPEPLAVRDKPAPIPAPETPPPPPAVENSILSPPNMTGPAHSKPLGQALSSAIGSVRKIADPVVERLVSAGEEFRTSGNMVGALKALRDAETADPNHPRILSDLAGVYTQMGQDEKAMSYWEKVSKLGPQEAGDYYLLAERVLRGEQAAPAGAVTDVLKIRNVFVNQQQPGKDGQWVTLKVMIEGDPTVNPDGKDVSLIVNFYDQVDGDKIKASTADTSQKFPSIPYDWQDKGVEEIEVIYHQPVFTIEQKRELGKRVYYGYVIELYYRDQFQDTKAVPEQLQQLRIEEMSNSHTAPPQKNQLGPENGLFPSTPPKQ